ncbi:FadR/GntR family transcriptional regulator [Paramicrobacterium chengjingii]|uniref:FadR/GntR family transcriptional regulator n=1 Tax=Paramicrobacterium chengjingii TaxID=2769067 RepID=UPI00142464C0|nr:FCD domain-containing protein [Microbacterium chengjingii]
MRNSPGAPEERSRRGYGGHADSLRDDVKQLILDLGLRPGDPIPPESSLIETLGVSRGSLREALKSMQALGIIETRHGSGTFVSHLSFEALADGLVFHTRLNGQDKLETIAELADIREILETQLIQRVAGTLQPVQAKKLEVILNEMDACVQEHVELKAGHGSNGELDELDRQFHAELYSGLDRRLVIELLEAFWRALAAARPFLPDPFMSGQEAVDKHRAIVDAVLSGDSDAAFRTMREHFASTRLWIGTVG